MQSHDPAFLGEGVENPLPCLRASLLETVLRNRGLHSGAYTDYLLHAVALPVKCRARIFGVLNIDPVSDRKRERRGDGKLVISLAPLPTSA